MDPPEHMKYRYVFFFFLSAFADGTDAADRSMVEEFFTTEHVKSLKPYIQKTVDELLDKMKAKGCADGPVDLVESFAMPVPSYVSGSTSSRVPVPRPPENLRPDHVC